jgi:hypothetical protein
MVEGFAPAEQFGIDLREFLDLIVELPVMGDAVLGGLPLGGGGEEELVDFADGQALGQEIEGAVFIAALMTVTVDFAAAGEPLDEGGAQAVGEDFELGDQEALALSQGQRGLAGGGVYLCHI